LRGFFQRLEVEARAKGVAGQQEGELLTLVEGVLDCLGAVLQAGEQLLQALAVGADLAA